MLGEQTAQEAEIFSEALGTPHSTLGKSTLWPSGNYLALKVQLNSGQTGSAKIRPADLPAI